jgi:hypothetical protein
MIDPVKTEKTLLKIVRGGKTSVISIYRGANDFHIPLNRFRGLRIVRTK